MLHISQYSRRGFLLPILLIGILVAVLMFPLPSGSTHADAVEQHFLVESMEDTATENTCPHEFKDRMFIDVTGMTTSGIIYAVVNGRPVSGVYTLGHDSRPMRLFVFNENTPVGLHSIDERVAASPGDMIEVTKRGYQSMKIGYAPGTRVVIEMQSE